MFDEHFMPLFQPHYEVMWGVFIYLFIYLAVLDLFHQSLHVHQCQYKSPKFLICFWEFHTHTIKYGHMHCSFTMSYSAKSLTMTTPKFMTSFFHNLLNPINTAHIYVGMGLYTGDLKSTSDHIFKEEWFSMINCQKLFSQR